MIWIILMILFAILAIIGLVWLGVSKSDKYDYTQELMLKIGAGGFLGAFFLMIICSFSVDFSTLLPSYLDTETLYSSEEIESLQDNRDKVEIRKEEVYDLDNSTCCYSYIINK